MTLSYDQTAKFEYELQSTTFMLTNQTYTHKLTYQIHLVQTHYHKFIHFLNKTTPPNYQIQTQHTKILPFHISTH
ncbi:DUF1949 domain-containing protein [Staphylococcus pasteuri]|uniref:DUF1949 domain-containing protein n=1 Tax=Staphylococcus pasteuri TaxID=45972 RepID=UPI0021C0C51D|nr:DUF1949 domain-containing protein [Staphylococcus pasteuri]